VSYPFCYPRPAMRAMASVSRAWFYAILAAMAAGAGAVGVAVVVGAGLVALVLMVTYGIGRRR
jgi:hypothetical protein